MTEYVYAASDSDGKSHEGRIQAENSALAVASLKARGLDVKRIRAVEVQPTLQLPRSGLARTIRKEWLGPALGGVPLKDLAVWYRQLATLINAGLSLYQALTTMEAQTANTGLKQVTAEAARCVLSGGRLSDVAEQNRAAFSELQIQMLRAGELSGSVDGVLSRIADYLERELALRRMISRLTLYPKLVLLAALFLLGRSFFADAVPAISKLVIGSMGKSTYTGLDYMMDTVLVLAVLGAAWLAGLAISRSVLYRSAVLRETIERVLWGIPGLGGVSRAFAVTRFCRAFSTMYGAGIPLGSAVRSAADASGSYVLRRAADAAESSVERGEPVSAALARSGAVQPLVLDMLRTGEQTGNLDTMMSKVSDHLESEAETRAHQYSHIFAAGVYLLVAMLVGYAVVSFYAGYGSSLGG